MQSTDRPITKILVIGATGAQGMSVVRSLARDRRYEVKIFTRDASSARAVALLELPGVTAFEGSATREADLAAAFRLVDGVYCNLDGFAIGEVNETFWGLRAYEIAQETAIVHFVWGSLDYLLEKGGFNPKYRCGHYDAKGRVASFILRQKPTRTAVSSLTSAPYMEMLYDGLFVPRTQADGTLLFAHPIGDGRVPMIALDDIGEYARWIFEHPEESNGLDLEVATEHVAWPRLVETVRRVTGKNAVFVDITQADYFSKSGISASAPSAWAQSSGASITVVQTFWENFSGWWYAWHDDLVTRDYALLDRILPGRVRTLEDWMRKTNYAGEARAILKDTADTVARKASSTA